MFKAEAKKISDLFNRKVMSVPRNQRKYVWDKTNWEDLFSDLVFILNDEYRKDERKEFVLRCRKRSALDDEQLISFWKRSDKNIIIVDFLYNYSFGDNIIPFSEIVKCGIDLQGLHHQQPIELTKDQYKSIIRGTNYEKNIDCD